MSHPDTATVVLTGANLGGNATQLAALWARIELEHAVDAALADHGWDMSEANMRSKLLCLRVARPAVAEAASSAWRGLSAACHHHAYELAPTAFEVEHLVGLVADVRAAAARREPEGSTS